MLRDMMIHRMRTEIRDPNNSSRYRGFFYVPKEEITRRERRFNRQSVEAQRINLNELEDLDDETLLEVYDMFSYRYNTWM